MKVYTFVVSVNSLCVCGLPDFNVFQTLMYS